MNFSDLSILVVEDSRTCQQEFERYFKKHGCNNITMVADVPMAILRIKQRTEELMPYNLILSDYQLHSEISSRTGQDLLQELRENTLIPEETTFVMVSGVSDYEKVIENAEIKPDGFYPKLPTKAKTNIDEDTLEKTIISSISKRGVLLFVKKLMEEKKYQEARKICRSFLRKEKKYTGEILTQLSRSKEKIEAERNASILLQEAEVLFYEEKIEEAISRAIAGIHMHEEYTKGYRVLAEIYEDTNNGAKAQKVLEKGLTFGQNDISYRRHLANVALENKSIGVAMEQFKKIISMHDPKSPRPFEDFIGLVRTLTLSLNTETAIQFLGNIRKEFGGRENNDFQIVFAELEIAKALKNEAKAKEALARLVSLFSTNMGNIQSPESMLLGFMEECFQNKNDDMAELVLKHLIKTTPRLIGLQNKIKTLPASFQNNHKVVIFLKEAATELHEESLILVKEGRLNEAVKQVMKAVEKSPDADMLKKSIIVLSAALRREWNEFYYRFIEKYYEKLENFRTNDIQLQTGAVARIRSMHEEKILFLRKKELRKGLNKMRDDREQERFPITNESNIVRAREEKNIFENTFHIKAFLRSPDDKKTLYTGYIRDISDGGLSISCDMEQENVPDFETYDQVLVDFTFDGKKYQTILAITNALQTEDRILRMGGYHINNDEFGAKNMIGLNTKIRSMQG